MIRKSKLRLAITRLNKPLVDHIGIDIDTITITTKREITNRITNYHNLFHYTETRTKHGWHFRIVLNEKISLLESFTDRLALGDDPSRICYDILRILHGQTLIDNLWDKKRRGF